ncbi:hypothetical protein RKLH11_4333 [Rhodobacteraceae bacterium KLH11]|nr:hypothetical protein RKLH11_4333 [Rhodobacteraceae bacterium KLH11]
MSSEKLLLLSQPKFQGFAVVIARKCCGHSNRFSTDSGTGSLNWKIPGFYI